MWLLELQPHRQQNRMLGVNSRPESRSFTRRNQKDQRVTTELVGFKTRRF